MGFQPKADWAEPAPWLFCITVDADEYGATRDELARALAAEGIDSRPFFVPLHTLPPFRTEASHRGAELPVTMTVANTGLNLPTYNELAPADVRRVAAVIRESARA